LYTRICRGVSQAFGGDPEARRREWENKKKEEYKSAQYKFRQAEAEFRKMEEQVPDRLSAEFKRAERKYTQALTEFGKAEDTYERDDFARVLQFARMDLQPYEVLTCAYFFGVLAFVILIAFAILGFILLGGFDLFELILFVLLPMLIIPVVVIVCIANYPFYVAKRIRAKTYGRMPDAINYMVMSMHLTPSLDTAIKYASDSVDEPLASHLKKILWNVYMREYDSIEEAFLAFAYEWGQWSEEFKRALYAIRSATLERTEQGIHRALERANEIIVEGTKRKIEEFAEALTTPTMVLFSLGIILPLTLAAMLPILGVGTESIIWIVIVLDVLFPIITALYAYHVLGSRPGTTLPPQIRDLQSKGHKCAIALGALVLGALLVYLGIWWFNITFFASLLIIWGCCVPIFMYCGLTSYVQKRERDYIQKMEDEFPEALFQLGSRIAEGKPIEQALDKTSGTMKRTAIGEQFRKISYNLRVTRSSLGNVLFGPQGVLKASPARLIKATMVTVVKAGEKDAVTAGRTIVGISRYLRELKGIETAMRLRLRSTTGMMLATALFFAPIVMGIAVVMYVMLAENLTAFGAPEVAGLTIGILLQKAISPGVFSVILGIYLILLVLITVYFQVGIEYGEDWLERKVAIAIFVPVALIVYTITTILAQWLIAGYA
jgi:Flp pilus assembly protein TadB